MFPHLVFLKLLKQYLCVFFQCSCRLGRRRVWTPLFRRGPDGLCKPFVVHHFTWSGKAPCRRGPVHSHHGFHPPTSTHIHQPPGALFILSFESILTSCLSFSIRCVSPVLSWTSCPAPEVCRQSRSCGQATGSSDCGAPSAAVSGPSRPGAVPGTAPGSGTFLAAAAVGGRPSREARQRCRGGFPSAAAGGW